MTTCPVTHQAPAINGSHKSSVHIYDRMQKQGRVRKPKHTLSSARFCARCAGCGGAAAPAAGRAARAAGAAQPAADVGGLLRLPRRQHGRGRRAGAPGRHAGRLLGAPAEEGPARLRAVRPCSLSHAAVTACDAARRLCFCQPEPSLAGRTCPLLGGRPWCTRGRPCVSAVCLADSSPRAGRRVPRRRRACRRQPRRQCRLPSRVSHSPKRPALAAHERDWGSCSVPAGLMVTQAPVPAMHMILPCIPCGRRIHNTQGRKKHAFYMRCDFQGIQAWLHYDVACTRQARRRHQTCPTKTLPATRRQRGSPAVLHVRLAQPRHQLPTCTRGHRGRRGRRGRRGAHQVRLPALASAL